MIWKRNCRRVRSRLALWAGHDLDETQQLEARRHMAACPHCRAHWQRLQMSQQALELTRMTRPVEPTYLSADAPRGSVWSEVHAQIAAHRALSERHSSYGWVPVGALAAACLAVAVLSLNTPPFDHRGHAAADTRAAHSVWQPTWPANAPRTGQPLIQPHWVSEESAPQPVGARYHSPIQFTEPRGF